MHLCKICFESILLRAWLAIACVPLAVPASALAEQHRAADSVGTILGRGWSLSAAGLKDAKALYRPGDARSDYALVLVQMRHQKYTAAEDFIASALKPNEAAFPLRRAKISLALTNVHYDAALAEVAATAGFLTEGDRPDSPETERSETANLMGTALGILAGPAESAWNNNRRTLALLLDIEGAETAALDLHGTIRDVAPLPPPLDELIAKAIRHRPDLAAYRLGLSRAQADVHLSQANRLPDVFGLYQPFMYQDNSPYQLPSSTSWAAGVTVTVPIFDRNQGNIRRALVNVDQSQLEMQAVEKHVVAEVVAAFEEYSATRRALEYIEREILPQAEKSHDDSLRRFNDGSLDAGTYFSVRRDLDDLVA